MKKKIFAIVAICLMFFIGCRENEVVKTFDQSENNGGLTQRETAVALC